MLFEEDYYLTTCTQALQRWSAEVFADSFAIQHCGPAYCFAFREMANLLPIREHAEDAFSITHPAISYRWHLHAAMLSKTAWWGVLQNQAADEYAWLGSYLPERKYTAPFIAMAELVDRVFRIFDKATREVISYCDKEFSAYAAAAIGDFQQLGPQVREYLQHGIPPAAIVIEGLRQSPMAPTVLNAAWFLSLEGMTATLALMGKEGDQEALDIAESRLAGWVSKTLEDLS